MEKDISRTDGMTIEEWAARNQKEYEDMMELCEDAMDLVSQKLEQLGRRLQDCSGRNPIRRISPRLKSPESIADKAAEKGIPYEPDSIMKHMHDIAGVRVICPLLEDVYEVAKAVIADPDLTILEKRDYIQQPKNNGYRSLHLIMQVPVRTADGPRPVTVELQLRTIAMDWWASLDHQLRYKTWKHGVSNLGQELDACAELAQELDERMEN